MVLILCCFFQGFEDKLKQKKEAKKRMGKTGGQSGTDESNSSTPQVRLIIIDAKYLFLCLFIPKEGAIFSKDSGLGPPLENRVKGRPL